jgi:hypothetical protein
LVKKIKFFRLDILIFYMCSLQTIADYFLDYYNFGDISFKTVEKKIIVSILDQTSWHGVIRTKMGLGEISLSWICKQWRLSDHHEKYKPRPKIKKTFSKI